VGVQLEEPEPEDEQEAAEAQAREHARLAAYIKSIAKPTA